MKSTLQNTKDLLAFGNPVYSQSVPVDSLEHIFRDYYLDQGLKLSSLSHTEQEVKRIAQYFDRDLRDIYLGQQASEDKLKHLRLSDYKIIHFASHGYLDDRFFNRSALILSVNENAAEDGFLQVREIYQLRLNADLVVLSACQTGKGKLEQGEGVLGLTRAFISAGAKSVVSTLWNIDDQVSSDFMTTFYQHLLAGKSKTQSLRAAKLTMIHSHYNHPFYWAAFVLNGDCLSSLKS
jgi:CHAT domain-containing protein